MNKKGTTWWLNITVTVLMLFLVVMGVLLLNLTSEKNLNSAKQKSDFARNQLHAKETLHVLSKITIDSDLGKISLPEALDKYFILDLKDNLNNSEDDLKTQLGSKILIETDKLLNKNEAYINAEYYWEKTLQDNFMLYLNPKKLGEFVYLGSIILPSSNSKMADYYINISLYQNTGTLNGKTTMVLN